ncbi:TetR/AcrR family transcriptional regulator [Nocardia sp. NRRL S-836]|uniref:TetR/AcrR family transcriptional regulator n=1 Tax=Nocardia sp. NRRL S-836 TaxID=1519492 RepID=UPI0006AE9B6A|nr:TetR/AcrR family transcriptional regulator [Nocardia sp. NRRL S-836]
MTKRAPTGAAVLQPHVTAAISEAVLDELAACGYGRLSMEAVAKRAGVGKSALYRRWPSKQDMVIAVLAELSVPAAEVPHTGSLRADLRAMLRAVHDWLTHHRIAAILPDLIAEGGRNPALSDAIATGVGQPRRDIASETLTRAVERGELRADLNVDVALDVLAGPIYWRLVVRHAPVDDRYLDELAEFLLRALGAD